MSIIYIFSLIIFFTLVILIKKSEKELDIIKTIAITILLLLAYNSFTCYILNLINVPITLLNLSIINYIVSILLLIFIIKRKMLQKFYFNKTNLAGSIIFLFITIIVLLLNYGNLTKIHYVSMDSREHYRMAQEFSSDTSLLNKHNDVSMPMAYINDGIIFKCFENIVGKIQLYKFFILLEACIYWLTGIIFYALLEKFVNSKTSKIIAILFSIIYILGYPLNAWIVGFHYLLLAILIIETIIYILNNNKKICFYFKIITMFLLNLGLMFSYTLFCPFVFLTEFIYLIYDFIKNKQSLYELITQVLITLFIPGIIGITYLLIPAIFLNSVPLALNGWIYENLWSNIILFIPFTIYTIYKTIKNKEFSLEVLLTFLLLIYMLLLYLLTKVGKVSEYYFYKNYYILWIMLVYLSTKGIIEYLKYEKEKYVAYLYTAMYVTLFIVMLLINKTYVIDTHYDNFKQVMQVFTFNKTMITSEGVVGLKKDEISFLKDAEDILGKNWDIKNEILFVVDVDQGRWIESLTGYKDILFKDKKQAIQNLLDNKYKFIILFNNSQNYENVKKYINMEEYILIQENDIGEILKLRKD